MNTLTLLILLLTFTTDVYMPKIFSEMEIPGTTNLLVTRLSHANSIDSPTYNPHATLEDLAKAAFESSVARTAYLKGHSFGPNDLETDISPLSKGGFHAIIEVGSKRTLQRVYVDTGSSLFWINCMPCVLTVPEEIFQPSGSKTYNPVDCYTSWSDGGLGAVQTSCDARNRCGYEILYAKGKFSKGHLAEESIKFARSEEVLDKIVLGCSKRTNLHANGVLGLGINRISLISQSKYTKFSYCLGDVINPYYQCNTLIIGEKIKLRGALTPFISQNQYFINLEEIKIDGIRLDADMQVFRRLPNDYVGGVAVDTGSTYTIFPLEVLEKFEIQIRELLSDDAFHEVRHADMRVCHHGNMATDLSWFPPVEFIFQDSAIMELRVQNLFHQVDTQTFCLAFKTKDELPFSVLGNIIQQSFYVAFDLKAMKLAFKRMDCNTIEEKIRHDEL